MIAYALALIDIGDREGYGDCGHGFMDIFSKYEGTIRAMEEDPTVLLSFPDEAKLRAWYDSDEYQALVRHGFDTSEASIAVIKGLS